MLQHSFLYRKVIAFFKQLKTKNRMLFLLFIILTLSFTTVHSLEDTLQTLATGIDYANLPESELLIQAKSLRRSNRQKSTSLVNKVLNLSKANKNFRVSAEAHTLLGELSRESKDIVQSKHHFLQASIIYKNINDHQNQIISSIDYVNLFFAEKRYYEADKIIDELLPIAHKYSYELPIALTLMTKGEGYYQQGRYNDAITQYINALIYLSEPDDAIQKQRAHTYTKMAESYKRINNREQTSAFYKKALAIFTSLQDLKYMARTLNTLAQSERYLEHYVIALKYSLRSLEIQKQLDDPKGRVKALMGAGIIYRHIGRYEKSITHINEAYLYYKKVNDISGIAKASNQLGLIYTRLKQFDQARSFYQLTIDLPEENIDSKTLSSALREMAVIDLNSNNYTSAMLMAKKSHKINQSRHDKPNVALTARIIGKIYRAQENYSEAIVYYKKSLSLATEIGSEIYQIKAQTPLGSMLIGTDTQKAISLLKKSLSLSTQYDIKSEKLYAYQSLKLAEKSLGNIAEALRYAEEEIALSIIIQREKDKNNLIRTKANLYSFKVEMELDSLREKTMLDQIELAKRKSKIEIAEQVSKISELELVKNKYASFALALLLAICLFVVFFIYRRFIYSRKLNKKLDYLAAHDPLTNCYNRRVMFDLMNRDFSDLKLFDEYCVIMADIDHFKDVNDIHGHSVGDTVLCGVARILQHGVRQNDIAARYGGEEFCLVLPGAAQDQAMRIAEVMRKKIEASHFDDITVTCSFGVASIQFDAKTPSELIDQADSALYSSKINGRNQVTFWDKHVKEGENKN